MKTVVSFRAARCLPAIRTPHSARSTVLAATFLLLVVLAPLGSAALIDVWRADDLTFNDGDPVGTWTSASNRVANGTSLEQPFLRRNVTPAGGNAVRFNGTQRLSVPNSPVGGKSAFSVALVFRAAAVGAANNAQWWGKTGLVDAEEPGVTSDWGTVITETGQVGIGTGNPDVSTYSTGASLADVTNYHAAVFTWGGGAQAVYVDNRPPLSQSGVSAAVRNSAGISFGGIRTGEANRRLNGDLVEIRFYDTALTSLQASNVLFELRDKHITGNAPRILDFSLNQNQIFLGGSATLSWNVSNATSVVIDPGIGPVAALGNRSVNPTATTTYTLMATNTNAIRTASVTLTVDPGVPLAANLTTNTPRNTPVSVTLQGSDPNGGTLTYSIVLPPAHGSLSGTPPNVTYTPAVDFTGLDSFTYRVNDGTFDSLPATVSIKVVPPPTAPTGIALSTTAIPAGAGPGAFVAVLQALDPNEGDTHTFLLVPGFGNNAQFVISGNALRAGPGFAGGPGATFQVRIRATDQTALFVEQSFSLRVVETLASVVINEIHYNPDFNPVRESFIELYNNSDRSLDLSQWRVRGGVDYFFPSGTLLGPRGFLVVAEDPPTLLSRYGVTAFGPWTGGLNNEGERITLRDSLDQVIDEVDFQSEFPWPIAANGNGPSAQLVHPDLDNDLGSSWRSALPPTPGATNVGVFSTNAAPHIRQVNHSPNAPVSTNTVTITCKVTDPNGVAAVRLAYQVVAPGQFIPATLPLSTAQLNNLNLVPLTNALNPVFEASSNWTTVTMHDDGVNGDEQAGDGIYSVLLPPQAHRTLVRYRITCTDTLGASRRAPFEDDPSLNFAYFVYNGLPAFQGIPAAALQTLPIYTLVTRDADLAQCTAWFNAADQLTAQAGPDGKINEGRLHFNWEGAFVYDGNAYDHITYRLRGANGRYHPGKRSFRFRFNDGRNFEAKDANGHRYPTKWREVTTGKGQSNRGSESFALNEVVNYFLFNKVGVPAPFAHHFHFRVIRGAQETTADPFSGDFWGVSWAQEKYDVNFLTAHDLPKGNLYKLVDNFVLGVDERRYQAAYAPTNAEDFYNLEGNLTGFQPIDWLLAHANYTNWYRYFTLAEAIRHYDTWPDSNKNGSWYFEPPYTAANNFLGRVITLPYDTTDTWGPTWNTGEDILFNGIFPSSQSGGDPGQHPELQLEYRNVVRELRALLFQPDQIYPIIDAHAGLIKGIIPADLIRWSNAPAPASYTSLLIAGTPGVLGGVAGEVQDMKDFMFTGGTHAWWVDRNSVGAGGWITRLDVVGADAAAPNRPTVAYVGTNGYPVDGLIFQSSTFSDPAGSAAFAAMQWRIAEVLAPGTIVSNPAQLRLELDAAWISPELTTFNDFITIPAQSVQPDLVYRVRVRHKNATGRWSYWSLPSEFRPGARDITSVIRTNLVFNEIMYNPPGESGVDGDEFEFLELKNIGPFGLNLGGLFFSQGIDYTFPNGTTLTPGGLFLLARNPAVLATRYPGISVQGVYSGKLNNDGETLALSHPAAGELVSVTYGDRAPWPVTADGFGFSLVLADPATGAYRASANPLGSPGANGGASSLGGVVINEVLSSSTVPLRDSIELRNLSGSAVDISGWYLTDDPTLPQKFRIPAGPALAAGAFRVFTEDDFNPTPGMGVSFGLSSFGDDVYLFSANAGGELTGYSHGFSFGAAQDGVTFGRYVNSVGEEQFPLQIARTPNAPNAGPRFGPVVMSEIHYHPSTPADEFLELRNSSSSAVPLFDPNAPTNTWRVNGIGFTFGPGVTLPPNGTLLLTTDNPAAFRARFAVPAAVAIFQYPGTLQDSGEALELLAPDIPATNGVPYYTVDAVRYNDRPPWPLAADGAGASLQRNLPFVYGDDRASWTAATPTPGTVGLSGSPPVITSQPQSRTNSTTTTATFSVSATGTEPLSYQWRHNHSNLDGATNSSLTVSQLQREDAGEYSVVVFNRAGSAESSVVLLVVRAGPSITTQPGTVSIRVPPDTLANPTNRATFTVGAVSYNPPLRFQWYFNNAPLPDATNTIYTFTNVTLANQGQYVAEVTDSVGPVLSSPASLLALVTPTLTLMPIPQSVATGAVVSFSAAAAGSPLPFTWEWRRGSATNQVTVGNERSSFYTFLNTNAVGSVQLYRVLVRTAAGQTFTNVNLTTLADFDRDGLPDPWEVQYGLNTNNAADAAIDSDHDGVSNADEYLAGTDPSDASSFLKVQLTGLPGTATISFGAQSNKTYSVEYRDALNSGAWTKLADVLARANNRVETIADPTANTNRFYRVVTPRQP